MPCNSCNAEATWKVKNPMYPSITGIPQFIYYCEPCKGAIHVS
jgi:hypothetical protein